MSKAASSPTARLLQSSRHISLPRPLPPANLEAATSAGLFRASDTATLPYPTHQAIVTTASSHFRGDWGLKRPLPKSGAVAGSTVRVTAHDTVEHITDFASAGDHVKTLEKFKEMSVPLVVKRGRIGASETTRAVSAFDDEADSTQAPGGNSKGPQQGNMRWKYNSPWIAGMQSGDFELYLRTSISKRKDQWKDYLRKYVVEKNLAEARREAMREGEQISSEREEELRRESIPTDELLAQQEKNLRDDHATTRLSSELTALICDFLDLPAVMASTDDVPSYLVQSSELAKSLTDLANHNSAPPSTHPSAGLSHLRTSAIMDNHPLWGPQANRSPVPARVIKPRKTQHGVEHIAKLGVGGIVADDPRGGANVQHSQLRRSMDVGQRYPDPEHMVNQLDPDVEGGNKIWVHPKQAWIDDKGRIRLEVDRGKDEAIAVKLDDVHHIHEARDASNRGPQLVSSSVRLPTRPAARSTSQQQSVAWGLDDLSRRAPKVEGFDAALGREEGQGEMKEMDAAQRIRELFSQHKPS